MLQKTWSCRIALPQDAQQMVEVFAERVLYPSKQTQLNVLTAQLIGQQTNGIEQLYVATDCHGTVVAYLFRRCPNPQEGFNEIAFVCASMAHKGSGEFLIENVLQVMRSEGCRRAFARPSPPNNPDDGQALQKLEKFWDDLGFKVSGTSLTRVKVL